MEDTHKLPQLAQFSLTIAMKSNDARCAFCHDRDQGKHGAVKREWSPEWIMFVPVCRKHAAADGMIDATEENRQILRARRTGSFATD